MPASRSELSSSAITRRRRRPPHPWARTSSRTARRAPRQPTVVLFDVLNDSTGASAVAGQELIHAVEKLESGDGLYLYFLTREGRIYPVRPLPGEDGGHAPDAAADWAKQAKPLVGRAMKATAGVRQTGIDIRTQVDLSYAALASLAGRLSVFPGRKNIVWITHGVPITFNTPDGGFADYTPQLRCLSEAAARANVAIYPVQQIPPGMGTYRGHEGYDSEDTLDQFAQLTGGRAVASDVGLTLHQAVNDLRTSYQVAYAPPAENWDGKFHKLRVACTRKGVRVQSRTAYYAVAEAADPQWVINASAANAGDSAEIGIRIRAELLPNHPGAVRLTARIDAADIAMESEGEGGRHTAALSVALAGYAASGQAQASPAKPLDIRFTAAELDDALKNGILCQKDVDLGPTLRAVRLIVLDNRLGVAGSVTMPVERLLKP